MENEQHPIRPVRVLAGEVARKIAAGEVIDRPAAVVRELLDNAIDAGATKISVEITGGGLVSIRIADNGFGMTAEDLALCTQTHTTSKISEEDDLLRLSTLGFRGEALSSIQAVSDLEITTTRNGHDAWKLEMGKIVPARLPAGTIVRIDRLFGNFPARKQFMKRPASETLICRQIFIEKALAWPQIEFRYSVDGVQKLILHRTETLRERCLAAMEPREGETPFYEITGVGEGFTFSAVIGSPDVVRSDRKHLMVFINGRRIMDYALLQAMEYGAEGHFPNGAHPFGFLFVEIDPSLVDFNIHPAKREARFRDGAALHHEVSSTMRNFFKRYTLAELHRSQKPEESREFQIFREDNQSNGQKYAGQHTPYRQSDMAAYHETRYRKMTCQETPSPSNLSTQPRQSFLFLGQVLGTFLAVEKNGLLYLIDQHAAHERILYDELFERSHETQELLIPYRIETSSRTEDKHLTENKKKLAEAGFTLEDEGEGVWQITAVPIRWSGTQKDLSEELCDTSIESTSLISHMYATAACRSACKDGDILDPQTAGDLLEKAFALEEPVCPHGRPIWIILDRQELFSRIRRT